MKFFTAILAIAFCIISASPTIAGETTTSYSLKKQGRVHFQDKKETSEVNNNVEAAPETINPADIEPAAGASEPSMTEAEETSLSERLRLPRKN